MSKLETPDQTLSALESVGYMTTLDIATVISAAANLNRPLLLEGPAGAGKTELALSVAKAEGMRFLRLQCYEGITDKQAVGDYNRALQEIYVQLETRTATAADWKRIKREILSREFFAAGPLLEAIESEQRCVLLIDELDKVDHAFEALLLEVLSVWEMSIPGMGTIVAKKPPFTVVTSNQERNLGYPLRRRSFYIQVDHPTPELEAQIVARKTPNCSTELHDQIAGFAQALRGYTMEKPPSISEMSDLARALELLGRKRIEPGDKGFLLSLIAKTEDDRKRLLMKDNFENLVRLAGKNAVALQQARLL